MVGSGPAGLAAAAQLNKAGHWVTVFERADRIGGLLMYGIPNMKLDKRASSSAASSSWRTRASSSSPTAKVGEERPGRQAAARVRRRRAVRRRDASRATCPSRAASSKGVHFAMDFLHANTKSLLDTAPRRRHYISAKDKDVVVIGGGDTGTDCVGTSMRHGCKSLVQLEILPRPPLDARPTTPGRSGPRSTSSTSQGSPVRLGGAPGTSRSFRRTWCCWRWASSGPEPAAGPAFGCELDPRGNVRAEPDKMTTVPGVFAAGDCSRGQSLVVWAISPSAAPRRLRHARLGPFTLASRDAALERRYQLAMGREGLGGYRLSMAVGALLWLVATQVVARRSLGRRVAAADRGAARRVDEHRGPAGSRGDPR